MFLSPPKSNLTAKEDAAAANQPTSGNLQLPAVPALQKIEEEEKEPVLPKLKSIQKKSAGAPADVLQRRLEKGKLNIVGEYHSWSDGRSDKEKEFVQENNLGGYWTEAQLKVANGGGPEVYADDPQLRALQSAVALVSIAEELISKELGFNQNIELQPKDIKIINTLSIEKIGKLLQQVLLNIGNMTEEKRTLLGNLNQLERFADIFTQNYKDANLRLQHIVFVKDKVQTTLMPLLHPTLNTREGTAITRSIRMLLAAERSNLQGVWKVGDAHIPDMELLFPGNNITLTKETEFKKNLMEFLIAKQKGGTYDPIQ